MINPRHKDGLRDLRLWNIFPYYITYELTLIYGHNRDFDTNSNIFKYECILSLKGERE